MAKVLVIAAPKILRHALTLALFPEHEVRGEESLNAEKTASIKDYDLLIVDGASCPQHGRLTGELARAIRDAKIPILWLEEEGFSNPPEREKLRIVKKPVEREAFRSAVDRLLSPDAPRRNRQSSPIELVDVVEEAPAGRQRPKGKAK